MGSESRGYLPHSLMGNTVELCWLPKSLTISMPVVLLLPTGSPGFVGVVQSTKLEVSY